MPLRLSNGQFAKMTGAKAVRAKASAKPKPSPTGRKRNRSLENHFDTLWRQLGGPDVPWQNDYKFNLPHSKMEMDRALPNLKVGIEINGGQNRGAKSGHGSWEGLERDARKVNACVLTGWKMFVLTTSMMTPENVIPIVEYIRSLLRERG